MNHTFLPHLSGKISLKKGFTLIELLVVIAIISLLTGVLVVSLPSLKGAADINKAGSDIAGILDQARAKAMASSTYTWVGFFEEDPTVTPASGAVATAGVGQLVISSIASADGTNLSTTTTFTTPTTTTTTPASLIQLSTLYKIPNVHLLTTSPPTNAQVPRPDITETFNNVLGGSSSVTPANYILGAFLNPDPNSILPSSQVSFNFPLTGSNPRYTFTQIIQFNPQGDASVIYDTPKPLIEIDLQPTHGNVPDTTTPNLVSIQVTGIGGIVTVYRP